MSAKPRLLCMVDLSLAPQAIEILSEVADVDVKPADDNVLRETIGNYDVYWGHLHTKVDAAVIARADNLKIIATATTGTDHIDKVAAAERGIAVMSIALDMNLIEKFTGTAEIGWSLLLMVTRKLRRAIDDAQKPAWSIDRLIGDHALSELTLGVLGVGRLGKMTCRYGKAFCKRVIACDLNPIAIEGIEQVDFDTLLAQSDAIALHVHMTPENYQLFNSDVIAKMKPGAVLINTSRGDLIDEVALLDALQSNHLGGFGADVLHNEWREDMSTHPVVMYAKDHDNVVITPHIGGAVVMGIREARLHTARKLAETIAQLAPVS